jgi:SAM-dependent methyltransferase
MYGDRLRQLFPDLAPTIDDLYLLETHQVAGLPTRAPGPELAAVLHAQPGIRRYLETRDPAIAAWLDGLLAQHGPAPDGADLPTAEDTLLWELADEIAYQRAPEACDEVARRDWDSAVISEVVDLDVATVIDAGAGTGLVAFAVAERAGTVYAVEPVTTLRAFMRARAVQRGLANVFALDGTLSAIPLPPASADVLVTRRAIGWDLLAELAEVERVLRPDGVALHLVGRPFPLPADDPLHVGLLGAGYTADPYRAGTSDLARYRRP